MRARPLNTKAALISFLPESCPSRACERALAEGYVTVLGGFSPPGSLPMILVRVQSFRGNQWWIGLRICEQTHRYLPIWFAADEVPWQYWDGDPKQDRLFIDGEDAKRCAVLRDLGIHNAEATKSVSR